MPVKIQVGLRPGLVASLNGLPTLNGDAFTLNKLSAQPEQTQEMIGDTPYTVLTWHSVLAAVKPGDFPLTVETPLTVQMRTAPRRASMPEGMFGDTMLNDPFFQSFFGGGTTEKQITVASDPDALTVLALPVAGRRHERRRRPAYAAAESDRHGRFRPGQQPDARRGERLENLSTEREVCAGGQRRIWRRKGF